MIADRPALAAAYCRRLLVAEALSWANEIRAQLGRPPVMTLAHGKPCDATKCVLARTIGSGVVVDSDGFTAWLAGERVAHGDLPSAVTAFIEAFDRREFPDLEEAA